jgi:hypothetical protein
LIIAAQQFTKIVDKRNSMGTIPQVQACVEGHLRSYPNLDSAGQREEFLSIAKQNGDAIRDCYSQHKVEGAQMALTAEGDRVKELVRSSRLFGGLTADDQNNMLNEIQDAFQEAKTPWAWIAATATVLGSFVLVGLGIVVTRGLQLPHFNSLPVVGNSSDNTA